MNKLKRIGKVLIKNDEVVIKKEDINDFSSSLLVVVDTNKYDLICLDNLKILFRRYLKFVLF